MTFPCYYADLIENKEWPRCPHCDGEMTGILDIEDNSMAWECDRCQLAFVPEQPEVPHA